jgi:hypothetical protein
LRSVLRFRGQVRPAGGEATAESPALYGIGVALLLTMGVAVAGAPSAGASTRHASRPCGEVTFEYSAARVQPGEAMDMDLFVGNCSHRRATESGLSAWHINIGQGRSGIAISTTGAEYLFSAPTMLRRRS